MVVVYKVHPVTFWVARRLVKVAHVAMANIVSDDGTGRRTVPELLQEDATAGNVAAEAEKFLADAALSAETRERLAKGAADLGPPGAGVRAAEALLAALEDREGRMNDFRRLAVLFKPHRRAAVVAICAMLGVSFFTSAVAYLIGPLFDEVLSAEARSAVMEQAGKTGAGALVGEKAALRRTPVARTLDRGLLPSKSRSASTRRTGSSSCPASSSSCSS